MKKLFVCCFVLTILGSCNSGIDSETYSTFQKRGIEISGVAQSTLLANVGKAIQQGGSEYAVEFCNLEAASIIDELNKTNDCKISRVTNKNRNPNNLLGSGKEKVLWEHFEGNNLKDTIIKNNKNLVYYKPIRIALPACLKCHGNPETQINQATKDKLSDLYPEDLATGYNLNDLRGLWKIEFNY